MKRIVALTSGPAPAPRSPYRMAVNRRSTVIGSSLTLIFLIVSLDDAQATAVQQWSEGNGRTNFTVPSLEGDVTIDGILDEDVWTRAERVDLPFETTPGNNTTAPVSTVCLIHYDTHSLYFGCDAIDPNPEQIRAFITDRDKIVGHDRVTLVLDPFNDQRRAFNFTVSALGIQLDGLMDQQQGFDGTWDAIWSSAGRLTSRGFTVEAAVPFKSLNFPNTGTVQTWGGYFQRWWPRSDNVQMLSMTWDRSNSCFLCQANLITGWENITPGRNVELTPSLTSTRSDVLSASNPPRMIVGEIEPSPALDVRWGVTTDIVLNGTVNPDFSQIEADVAQLEVNNRFALFFPEKRPFFLEDTDFFTTPEQTVLTRTIADPSLGGKATAKIGSTALGAIAARDAVTNILIPGRESSSSISLDQIASTTIGRIRRDVGPTSTIGGLWTGRSGREYYNRVGGVDAFLQPLSAATLQLQYIHSETRYPDSLAVQENQPFGSFGGDAALARFDYATRNWAGQFRLGFRSPGFRSDAGFIPQVDMKQIWLSADRIFWGSSGQPFSKLIMRAGYWRREDFNGGLVGDDLWLYLDYTGPWQSNVLIIPRKLRVSFAGTVHDVSDFNIVTTVQPTANVTVGFVWNVGGGIDVANRRPANRLNLRPSLGMRIGRRFDFSVNHNFQRLSHEGSQVFDATVTELRTVYNFSARAFVRLIAQLRTTDRNPELYLEPVNRNESRLSSQLLLSYKLNPESVFFLGYDDTRSGSTAFDFVQDAFGQTARSFFVKLSYAWRP